MVPLRNISLAKHSNQFSPFAPLLQAGRAEENIKLMIICSNEFTSLLNILLYLTGFQTSSLGNSIVWHRFYGRGTLNSIKCPRED